MAGSYSHVTTDGGKFLDNENFVRMIENLGDAYEMAEEMYGMIWSLATDLERASGGTRPATENVEWARSRYRDGLQASPGTDGTVENDDEDE